MEIRDILLKDNTYRIRTMNGLKLQIDRDYDKLKQLWKRRDEGAINSCEIKEAQKQMSWLRKGLRVLDKLGQNEIEGVISGNVIGIDKWINQRKRRVKDNPGHIL